MKNVSPFCQLHIVGANAGFEVQTAFSEGLLAHGRVCPFWVQAHVPRREGSTRRIPYKPVWFLVAHELNRDTTAARLCKVPGCAAWF